MVRKNGHENAPLQVDGAENKYMYHVYVIFGIKTHTKRRKERKSTPSKHIHLQLFPLKKKPFAKQLSAWP